ncbi:OmpA family protein [Vibrio sp. TH_r3]|uniref:OmpA family protein n=1 Tax=Vibrio sp. TH_r3 TaxID=3082084 RepID=UPI002955196E|nr:OmpA family protein [Vibrio sp. TH_r3]MDV7103457.1 OmpA family protein [Vibrio sp. TH_r3]
MRWIVHAVILILTGCATIDQINMLDTAPQSEYQLRHPEWAGTSTLIGNNAISKSTQTISNSKVNSLADYLSQQNIRFDVYSGSHIMIKLQDDINFVTGSARVSESYTGWLNRLAMVLSNYNNIEIIVDGHTDNTGETQNNERLSERRAATVKSILMKESINSAKLYTRGYGEYMPACSNQSAQGRACNRRVELTLIIPNN